VNRAGTSRARLGVGAALIAMFWALSWQPRGGPWVRGWFFFGLWLGYILVVDALCQRRTGTSPLTRSPRGWALLFVISAPAWWLFEVMNHFLGNWEYLGAAPFGPVGYAFFATVSFSTVVPAVFTTAELLAPSRLVECFRHGPVIPMTRRAEAAWVSLGLALLVGMVVAPKLFFPGAWLAVFFILDPLNHAAGRPSVAERVAAGDWRIVAALGAGALACGFCWELWNVRAWPKWIYHVPYVGGAKVFEMPILGYLGYIPFGLELYALYHALVALVGGAARWPLALDDVG
jgi:hypothetical protein